MKPKVKILKRGRDESSESSQTFDERKTGSPSGEREIISTVKGWIAEGEERRRLSERRNWELLIKFAQ